MHVTAKTNGEWANHAGSMLLDSLDSDANSSLVIQFFTIGSTSYKTTPETLAYRHCSLGMRQEEDYTHCVMLNNCVSARWSPMCQCLSLTSLRDSQPLPTRYSRESLMH